MDKEKVPHLAEVRQDDCSTSAVCLYTLCVSESIPSHLNNPVDLAVGGLDSTCPCQSPHRPTDYTIQD